MSTGTSTTTVATVSWSSQKGTVRPRVLKRPSLVTITKDGESYTEFTAAAVLGSAPKGMWLSESSLSSSLNDDAQVGGVVVGVSLAPTPLIPDTSLPVNIQTLLYEAEDSLPWAWGTNEEPTTDPYAGLDGYTELTTTIADPAVAAVRAAIVTDLMGNGFLVNNLIDTTALTDRSALGLLDAPVLNTLGENPVGN